MTRWQESAVCAKLSGWHDANWTEQRAVCRGCPVRDVCLQEALDDRRAGRVVLEMRGGLTEQQRERMLAGTYRGPGRPREPIKHGTVGGRQGHLNRGETPCEACREAKSRSDRDRYLARKAVA